MFAFLTQIMKKYAMVEISTKKKITCDTESINVWIWDDEAYRFTDFSNITSSWRHNVVALYWTNSSDLRSEYQIEYVCRVSTHNGEYRLRYCYVTQKEQVIF